MKLEAGTFHMGLPSVVPEPWKEAPSEGPEHEVSISAFEISEEPISLHQLCEVLAFSGVTNVAFLHPSTLARLGRRADGLFVPKAGQENVPACTSWQGAKSFCELLSRKIGKKCRLPTEAEWEFAAAGADKRTYPWGANIVMRPDVYSHALGINPDLATPGGIQDLNGPVAQWCLDNYEENFYARSPRIDPVCHTQTNSHVVRGGPMMRYMDALTFAATWKRFQSHDPESLRDPARIGVRVVIPSKERDDQ